MFTKLTYTMIEQYILAWTSHHYLSQTAYKHTGSLLHVQYAQPLKETTTDFLFMQEYELEQMEHLLKDPALPYAHWLTVFCEVEHSSELQPFFERMGYQCRIEQPLMVMPLHNEKEVALPVASNVTIDAACTILSADWANAFSEGLSAPLTQLSSIMKWQYHLTNRQEMVSQGIWIMTPGRFAYIDDIETKETYRNQGFAKMLMQRMMQDASRAGATAGILCSTPMGLPLYLKLGFTIQGTLLVLSR